MMRRKAHRVFAVGVGSAVAEEMLRRLAQETGGACELVSPREGMAEKIAGHFQRILLPRAEKVLFHRPVEPLQVVPPVSGPVFHGDTLHVSARFSSLPTGPVSLGMILEDSRSLSQTIPRLIHHWQSKAQPPCPAPWGPAWPLAAA